MIHFKNIFELTAKYGTRL